ncbi:hypothetical protein ACU6DI_002205 [Vibrio navarrensis]
MNTFTTTSLALWRLAYKQFIHFGLVVIGTLALSACGGGDSGGGGGGTVAPSSNNSLLPTSTQTKWFYSDSSDQTYATTTQVAGSTAQVLNYPTGAKEYFVTDKDSISFAGFYSPYVNVYGIGTFTIDFRFNQPLELVNNSSVSAQKSFSASGTANINPTYGARNIEIDGTSTVVGIETITVPYGTFEATHVKYDLEIGTTIDGYYFSIPSNVELWFVKNIGIVRRVEHGNIVELTNFIAPDRDNDGIPDSIDQFPDDNQESADTDGDGIGNNQDTDDDNDGVSDDKDDFPLNPNEQVDTDNDGIGNNTDTDDDNDGIIDSSDLYPLDETRHDKLATNLTSFDLSVTLGSLNSVTQQLLVSGTNIDWSLTTDNAWLKTNKASGNGPTSVEVSVDATKLTLGKHSATLTLKNELDGTETEIKASIEILLPEFTLSKPTLSFDITDGWKPLTESLEISLNTGVQSYPLRITAAEGFTVNALSSISGATQRVDVQLISFANFKEGENSSTIEVSVDVLGHQITKSFNANVLASRHSLLVPDRGISLTKFPTKEKLTAQIDILDSYNLADTAWTATTNAKWLSVTPSGTTSDKLVVSANTDGLAENTLYQTEIEISSGKDSVVTSENIRVALWIGSNDPELRSTIAGNFYHLAADPVRPYIYANQGQVESAEISIYHSHTNAYIAGLQLGATHQFGHMQVSEDGRWLYAGIDGDSIAVFDLINQSLVRIWQGHDALADMFTLVEPSGKPVILSSRARVYEPQTGKELTSEEDDIYSYGTGYIDASLYGKRFCTIDQGLSPYTITCYELSYNSYRNTININRIGDVPHGTGSNGRAVAVNKDGSKVYAASGWPYNFLSIDIDTMMVTESLPADSYPNGVVIGENDKIHGIIDGYYAPTDLWIYNADGSESFKADASGYNNSLINNALAVSGDGYQTFTSDGKELIIINSY